MKRFRAFIITRKNLTRTAVIFLIAAACGGLCLGIKNSEPKAVEVFADAEGILNEGIPNANEQTETKGILSALLGFDVDKPETIINESSEAFKEASSYTTPPATELPSYVEAETATPAAEEKQLPSHDEIVTARRPEIKNNTSYNVDIDALCCAPLETKLTNNGNPEVLIVHTHTTECYSGDAMSGEGERTTNEAYNVCAVGDVLADTLESYGIHTIHDKTIHDYPSYQGAYTRALNTITSDIQKYPDVKVVIDLHRDAFIYSDGSKLRVAAEINGSSTAQVMLVLGTDSMGLYHPYWQSNLSLALKIQNAAEIMYPGMMRPIDLRRERFNMHVTKGSILIEIGSNGNSLAEAKSSAGYIGDAIAAALING